MAKIGILTFHRPCNFGANLQAYSSYLYFTSLGHNVKVIDYIRPIDENYINKVDSIQYNAHQSFSEHYLSLTHSAYNVNELRSVVENEVFDLIIVGADAVWSKGSNSDFVFFCKWVKDCESLRHMKLASVSAACMGSDYTKDECAEISECLSRFNYITVRDTFTKSVVQRALPKCNAVINPDPVFLLSSMIKDTWVETDELRDKQYVLMTLTKDWYANGALPKLSRWFEIFKNEVHKRGYKLVELPLPEGFSGAPFDYTIPYPIDPIQWFLTIKHAHAFCGLRFHSIVSCISNGIPFFSIDTYGITSNLISRLKYNLHLYAFIQPFESMSKIRNLLKGSGFESYRLSTSINVLNPHKLMDKLDNADSLKILAFRDKNVDLYKSNVNSILKLL